MSHSTRRQFLFASTAVAGGLMLPASALMAAQQRKKSLKKSKVVVIGGGFGGATCAKYLSLWGDGAVEVTLVERNPHFISCPLSNLVLSGDRQMSDITLPYSGLAKRGIGIVQDEAAAIDPIKKEVRLARGKPLRYDRLVLAPGIDFMLDGLPGLQAPGAFDQIPHGMKAGPQTVLLRRQLEAMPDGGVFAISIPKAPYRCPPGPYERACMVASYFKRNKPKSKVLVLDANEKIQSKEPLFKKAFEELYAGTLEYRPNSELKDVDVANKTAQLEFDAVKADVLNIIPPQRAGQLAVATGLKLANGRWVEPDWLTLESANTPGIHVLGDALFPAPIMPKSGHMANQHAKLAAAAIINLLAGEAPNPEPMLMNTCYSFVNEKQVIHVASIHRYDAEKKNFEPNPNKSGGVSVARNELEGKIALDWARNIWADALT
jgi:sulfide dehydrogenase [flavocytochrome c] flavoprotein subunit